MMVFTPLLLGLLMNPPESPRDPNPSPVTKGRGEVAEKVRAGRSPPPRVDASSVSARVRPETLLPAGSPRLSECLHAARRQFSSALHRARRWRSRTRSAALMPDLNVGYDHRGDSGWKLDQQSGSPDDLGVDAGINQTLRTRLSWRLDGLVYSPEELRVHRVERELRAQRSALMLEVAQAYFDLAQRWLDFRHSQPEQRAAALLDVLRATAVIEILTGLEFPELTHASRGVRRTRSKAPTSPRARRKARAPTTRRD